MQLWFIASGYAAVLVSAAVLILGRYLQERYYAGYAAASGGMYAAGDLFLAIFIFGLFMIPTMFLVWFMARFQPFYERYSQLLVGLSLSAPVCLILSYLEESRVWQSLALLCFCRLLGSPFVLVGIAFSRLVARFDRARKLLSYALLTEGLTLGIAVTLLFVKWH